MGFPAEWVLLAVDSVVFTIIYKLYKSSTAATDKIKSCPDFEIGPDLMAALEKAPERTLPYACIEGVVEATGKTLKSNYGNEEGVIKKLLLQEHRTKRTQGHWSEWIRTIQGTNKSVPFVLRNPTTPTIAGSVLVHDPIHEGDLHNALEITHNIYEPNKSNVIRRVFDYILGDILLGKQITELMLKVSTKLVGVGEITLRGQHMTLIPPKDGGKYILSALTKQEIIDNIERQTSARRFILKVLALMNLGMIAYTIYKLYSKYVQPDDNFQHGFENIPLDWNNEPEIQDNHAEIQDNQPEIQDNQPEIQNNQPEIQDNQPEIQNNQPEIQNNQQEVQDIQPEIIYIRGEPEDCVICLAAPRDIAPIPCGHLCMCTDCARALPRPRTCPICRRAIRKIQTIYHV